MKMYCLTTLLCCCSLLASAMPRTLSYNGMLYENGNQINGDYVFKFSIITNSAVAWTSGNTVSQTVEYGYFTTELGDTSIMNEIPEELIVSPEQLYLRIEVAPEGSALSQLSPDRRLTVPGYSINADNLTGVPANRFMRLWTNVIIVAPGGRDGGGNTDNLAAAITMANARATATDPYTILLLPGSYSSPAVPAAPGAYVHIVGTDRDNCIIQETVTLAQNTHFESLTVIPQPGMNGIQINGGHPYINNVKIEGGSYGIFVNFGARADIHNVEIISGVGTVNAAVWDEGGARIDGLRVYDREAFIIDTIQNANYKNIYHESGGATDVGTIQVAGGGFIRSLVSDSRLNVQSCTQLRLRDIDIDTGLVALNIAGVGESVEVYDSRFESTGSSPIVINYDGSGIARFDDVHVLAAEDVGINISMSFLTSIKDCDIYVTGAQPGIFCGTMALDLYIQTTRIRAGATCIFLDPAVTELWLYDATLRSTLGAPTITGGVRPRIADSRLETDTNPTQIAPANWNAFGPPGLGNPEDSNGNIVAPMSGTPLTP